MSAVLPYLSVVCRGTVVVVFALSAVSKLRSRAAYARFRRSTRLLTGLPEDPASALARLVIAGEVTVAVTASAGPLSSAGLGVAGVLLCGFTWALARSPESGQALECGCFGSSVSATRHTAIARNLLLLGVVFGGLVSSHIATGAVPVRWDATLVCVVGAVALATFITHLHEITSLFTARL
ncbi:MauE/DoxX family redox-associated membrane protein [Plantactinospora sp. CA-294935]|uniref:MauE/DoxX family redox-associated membrane protein n=1 Tax=Plantactinospora sp. CA-294935 TaxID=3240012 RepID=UPI003D8BBCA0